MQSEKTSQDALQRLEDVVSTMTDMAYIKRKSRTADDHQIEISPALVKEAVEAFNLFDKDGNHGLDIAELGHVFRAVGQNPSDAELREIMKKHDLNNSGKLEQAQFEQMIISYMKPMWQVKEELKDAFRIFDKDGNGTIDKQELEHVLKRYGEPLTHRQSKELIDLMDKNKDGIVDMDDFVEFLCEVDQPDYFKTHYRAHSPSNIPKFSRDSSHDATNGRDSPSGASKSSDRNSPCAATKSSEHSPSDVTSSSKRSPNRATKSSQKSSHGAAKSSHPSPRDGIKS